MMMASVSQSILLLALALLLVAHTVQAANSKPGFSTRKFLDFELEQRQVMLLNETSAPSYDATDSPTTFPTEPPTSSPTSSPTSIGYRTKSCVTNVLLMDIDEELAGTTQYIFESTALNFIRDTQLETSGYSVTALAVTVLSQEIVYNETSAFGATVDKSLNVGFHTLAIVSDGKVSDDFDLASVTENGFEKYFGQFNYRLASADAFFEPLLDYIESAAPTNAPTSMPSVSPTSFPTTTPSVSPTSAPTVTASSSPTVSFQPTGIEPTASPTSSPSESSYRTKSCVIDVRLEDVEREMTNAAMASFEKVTLKFIKDSHASTPGYNIEVVSVAILTQAFVYNQTSSVGATNNVVLYKEGLEVGFKVMAMVTSGVAPADFDLTDVVSYGFDRYSGEYNYRLAMADDFFKPLLDHVDSTTLMTIEESDGDDGANGLNDEKSMKHGQFVAAIFFASFTMVLAVVASVFAVRKHLRKTAGGGEKLQALEYPGYGNGLRTQTMSGENDSKDEFHGNNLHLRVDGDEFEMENVGLTPVSEGTGSTSNIFGVNIVQDQYSDEHDEERPLTPGNGFKENKHSKKGKGFAAEAGKSIKKWLTPRRTEFKNMLDDMTDPPDSEAGFENLRKPPRKSMEPDAKMASTHNASGVYSQERTQSKPQLETFQAPMQSKVPEGTPVSIPVSFFGQQDDADSDASSANMGSVIGSTASSFFTKMNRKSSIFAGRKSGASAEPGMSTLAHDAGSYDMESVTGNMELNAHNLAKLQAKPNGNVEASVTGSEFDELRSKFEKGARQKQQTQSRYAVPSKKAHSAVAKDNESVYSEPSELDVNDMRVQATLGARVPPQYHPNASETPSQFYPGLDMKPRQPLKAPSSVVGARSQVSYSASSHNEPSYPVPNRDARSIAEQEERRRSTLSAAIEQGDTYDVFAPPGPIGIVVDTSKMGPAVHSLKSNSPMLGLINPGDLIIALDDEDTRNVTAAALTRMMAKKSRQKERKITLLAPDGF